MGIVYLDSATGICHIQSDFIFYGEAASQDIAAAIASQVAEYWNAPEAPVLLNRKEWRVRFVVNGIYNANLQPDDVWYNNDPSKNFFRIEEYSSLDVSFVDGIGCNTGYFKLANLLQTGTTAAHEYGHTLGLDHPFNMDIRGEGPPGIMYPRGTITDPSYLYNPLAIPGDNTNGGTMNPVHRQVKATDIAALKLHRLSFSRNGQAVIGDFSSVWHERMVKG